MFFFFFLLLYIVLNDLRTLEKQQIESKQQLARAARLKQEQESLKLQYNEQLEAKKFSNGSLQQQVAEYRLYLSGATRDMSSCTLKTKEQHKDIQAFTRRLENGSFSSKLIVICHQKVTASLLEVEKNVQKLERLKEVTARELQEKQGEYDTMEQDDQKIRQEIQVLQNDHRKLSDTKASIRIEITQLENEKSTIRTSEEETKLQIQKLQDELQAEKERASKAESTQSTLLQENEKERDALKKDLDDFEASLKTSNDGLETQRQEIILCKQKEGWSETSTFDFSMFRSVLAQIESESEKDLSDLSDQEREIEELEKLISSTLEEASAIEGEAQEISIKAKGIVETQEKRKKEDDEIIDLVASARAETNRLEAELSALVEDQEAEEKQSSEQIETIKKEIAELKDELKSKKQTLKMEEVAKKACATSFEEMQKPQMMQSLSRAEKKGKEGKRLNKELDESEKDLEEKVKAEFAEQLDKDREKMERKVKDYQRACKEYLKSKLSSDRIVNDSFISNIVPHHTLSNLILRL